MGFVACVLTPHHSFASSLADFLQPRDTWMDVRKSYSEIKSQRSRTASHADAAGRDVAPYTVQLYNCNL